jgi:diguanylate cyclase (GGDEF)-like protein
MTDPKLTDEPGRLLALHRYGVLDSLTEPNFDAITSVVKGLLAVPICAVSLVDQDRQWFKSIQGLPVRETCRSMAFCDHTIRARVPMVVADATRDPRFASNPLVTEDPFIRSYAGAPLKSPDGYNLGSLCVIDREPRNFSPADLALLEQFSRIVVDQLELRTLAHRDFLTGVLTRRAFVDTVTAALHQVARVQSSAAIVTFDVDHFKAINDGFGHPVGDQVLKRVTRTVGGLLRPTDVLGGLGGEEFGLLLHTADRGEACACAERLRLAIAASVGEGQPPVTASFGLAMVGHPAELDAALAGADAALYAAKRDGRNRTRVAPVEQAAAA